MPIRPSAEHDEGMPEPVTRQTLLTQRIPTTPTSSVEVRRITLLPRVSGGAHVHNCPVLGSIERGSVVFQVEGEDEQVLRPGDVFYEPADRVITRWDATEEGVTFLGYFLLSDGQRPELTPVP